MSDNTKSTRGAVLPCGFQKRVASDLEKLKADNAMPLPKHIRSRDYILTQAADAARTIASAQRRAWATARKKIECLVTDLSPRDQEIKRSLDGRVRELWGDANLALIEHVIKTADPDNGQEVADFIIQGVPIFGDLPKTCLFEEMSSDDLQKFKNKQAEAVQKFALKEKHEVPKWATQQQLEEAHKAFLKKARNPREIEAPFAELKTPVYCFPVSQGDRTWDKASSQWIYSKIRPCMDFRLWNGFNKVSNKISYAGPEMVTRCCMEFLGIPADYRLMSRKQVHQNIECERGVSDYKPYTRERPLVSEPRPFAIAKTDFTNYYYLCEPATTFPRRPSPSPLCSPTLLQPSSPGPLVPPPNLSFLYPLFL